MGRVIGTNVAGGEAVFPGVAGSFIIKLFELSAAKVGLSLARALELGLDAAAVLVVQADRAHFYPEMELMYLELIVERPTGRVLGLSGVCKNGYALKARIDAVAALMPHRPTLEELSNLEVTYSPPFASALDIINAAANTAQNLLEGRLTPVGPEEFSRLLAERDTGQTVFLDLRGADNAGPYLEALAPHWVHLPQETLAKRLDEVPRDKRVVLICNSGVRSYEAQVTLKDAGFDNTLNLSGGVAAVKRGGEPIIPDKEK